MSEATTKPQPKKSPCPFCGATIKVTGGSIDRHPDQWNRRKKCPGSYNVVELTKAKEQQPSPNAVVSVVGRLSVDCAAVAIDASSSVDRVPLNVASSCDCATVPGERLPVT